MPRHFAIVPAAGSGARFGAELPKQYLPLAGQPLIYHSLLTLCHAPQLERVVVVLSPEDAWWRTYDWRTLGPSLETTYTGGATRAESVMAGLSMLTTAAADDDWVLVHDAARPCLSSAMLNRMLFELEDDPVGGLLAVPVADTLKREESGENDQPTGRAACTISRTGLWQAQTPQMFRYSVLCSALEAQREVTDEAGAIEAAGLKPRLIRGDSTNMKVTYPADLSLAEWIMMARRGQ